MNPTPPAPVEDFGRGRTEALSDGVFAIVLTLLVLELKVPHLTDPRSVLELAHALLAIVPKIVSWVISFVTVAVIWVNHHRFFRYVRVVDDGLLWHNANLLLWTSLLPYPTALMGDYHRNPLGVSLYGVCMALMALSFVLMRGHLIRHWSLAHEHVDRAAFEKGRRASLLMGPVAYLVGAVLAWVYEPIAFALYATIAMYFVTPLSHPRTR